MSEPRKLLPDGIYVNLSEEAYFGQDRLGSTDLVHLHKDPASWWYGSRHNPDRPERERTEAMEFGSALHVLVLEGDAEFEKRCVISPFEDFRTKEARMWRDEMRINRKIILTEDSARRVRHMAALILNHPELGPVLNAGLSEVSVLFTNDQGVKLRARFDKLLPRFVCDLKSFGDDARGRSVRQQCLALVAQRDMDVQRFLYFQARMRMGALIEANAVFGATPEQVQWLQRVAAIEDWEWCWIFFRRRDDQKATAPIVKPILRKHLDATFDSGRRKVQVGLTNYANFIQRFGFEIPWAVVEPADEPADHEFPAYLADVHEPAEFPDERTAA